ncbi:hypothetical protein [Halorubrum persicum]|uniref:hypothetical protein n=1 Tax=Halorubrum persicum TaxID=1383844 RepID=UPI001181B376|nr:hypothetical protein [Halorubrum persicum]
MAELERSVMGIFETVADVMEGSTQRAPGRAGDDGSEGSYWCDDCGEPMQFERASGTGCAC